MSLIAAAQKNSEIFLFVTLASFFCFFPRPECIAHKNCQFSELRSKKKTRA